MSATPSKQDIVTKTVSEWLYGGKYRFGDKLPTNEEIAKIIGVNPRTVAAGLDPLVAEGILERAPRRGTIVKGKILREISNSVALLLPSRGDVYGEMVRFADSRLVEHGMFPIVLDASLHTDRAGIRCFLTRMTSQQQPFGFLADGQTAFPYDLVGEHPEIYGNTVFLFSFHHHHEFPFCRYVLRDLHATAKIIVDYFVDHGARHLAFAALHESSYCGIWSSMQEQLMREIEKYAPKRKLRFDSELFWQLHGGAPIGKTVKDCFTRAYRPDAVFCWSDRLCAEALIPALSECGISYPSDIMLMGAYNTPWAKKFQFPTLDIQANLIASTAIDMLLGTNTEHKILIPPKLIDYSVLA